MTEETIFEEALSRTPEERAAFLEQMCAGRPDLRAAVEALLAAHSKPGNILDKPPVEQAQTFDSDLGAEQMQPNEEPPLVHTTEYRPLLESGLVIAGRYTLVQKIGEGGMGEVWVAKQTEPVKRKVALKLIKTGMDTKAVLARFEQERQALAMMDHPNIARVLDGGMTATGQPFFVMELVNGLPLNKFSDEMKLAPRERLELFVLVCQAVQHAHQKGIVHRDLKPANILVTMIDARPVPKVIDFGVAKATAGKLTDESVSTQLGAVVGTLEYMSPEQTGFSGDDVDTRADIYSLGVILYELLTGLKPIDGKRLRKAAFTEMVRIIREEEPSKPSTRLSTDESLPSLAALRQMEPKRLMALLRGELDWVVMKCLEKHRERRYETANALSRDIQRYLADEMVEARPPSAGYRLKKFVRRNKGQVIAASLVLLALLTGLAAVVAVQAVANDKIQGKNNELVRANEAIAKSNSALLVEQAKEKQARDLAEKRLRQSLDAVGLFANDARRYCEDAMVPGESRRRLYEVLITQLERQVDQEPGEASIDVLHNKLWMYQTLCAVNHDFGQFDESKKWFDKGLTTAAEWEKHKPGDPAALSFRAKLLQLRADSLNNQRKLEDARRLYAESLEIRRKLAGDPAVDLPASIDAVSALADSLDSLEQFEESIALRDKICKMFAQDEQKVKQNAAKYKQLRERSYPHREALSWTYMKAAFNANDYATRKTYLIKADELSGELMKERTTNRNVLLRWAMISKMFGELEYNYGTLVEKDGMKKEAEKYFADAEVHFNKHRLHSKKLATSNELIDGIRDYSRSFYTLGLAEKRNGKLAEARRHFQMSWDIRSQTLHDYANAPLSAHLEIDLYFSQIALGELSKTMTKAEDMIWIFTSEPEAEYRLACVYSLAIDTITETRSPAPLTEADVRLQKRYRNQAFQCLQLAHDGGFSDFFQSNIDADFAAIRDDPAMKEFEATYQYRLGIIENKRGDVKKAHGHFEKAEELARQFMKTLPTNRRFHHVKAAALCTQIKLGHQAEAIREADALPVKARSDAAVLFHLARAYSLASAATGDPKLQEHYRDQAIEALDQASRPAFGLAPVVVSEARLVQEDDLDPIRGDPRFKAVLKKHQKR